MAPACERIPRRHAPEVLKRFRPIEDVAVALAFGLSMPNMMNATMQPLPEIAGAAGAVAGTVQMTAGATSSGLVALLYDGRSPLSMTSIMAVCSLLALVLYLLIARPAERSLVGFDQARFGEADG